MKTKLTESLTVTIGREVLLDPMIRGAKNPTIPELAAAETATRAEVLSAETNSISGWSFVRARIDRPGSSNHRRIVLVDAAAVSDEVLG
jgi:hypothetical protein